MIELIVIMLSALAYAIKGGAHGRIRHWLGGTLGIIYEGREHRPVGRLNIGQKLYVIISDGKIVSALLFAALAVGAGVPPQFAPVFAGWLIAVAPSVGEEIGAIGGIDGNWNYGGLSASSGWKRGAMRGVWTGAALALALGDTGFIVAGLLFPVTVWLGVSAEQIRTNEITVSWWIHEWLFGAVLGLALVF